MADSAPHICFVAPYAFPVVAGDESSRLIGGAEVQQAIIARGLVARGYKVSMICIDFGQDAVVDVDGIRILRAFRIDAGIPIVRFLWPRMTSLWSCMRRVNADVYYQRGAGMLTGLVAAYCKRYGKKSVFSAAANLDFERNTPRIRYSRDRWLYGYGLRHVDRLLAQNAEQATLCMRNVGRRCAVVPNCYEAPPLSRAATGRDILWVGTINWIKRPELFLDLAAALPQYQFKMVGGAARVDPSLFYRVKGRAEVVSNLTFVGFVPYSQVDEHFDRAALLVNTSQSEGFPNTFLQAWSRGIVTVASVDCGARLDGAPVGRVVSSLEQFVGVLKDLMSDDLRRQQEGMRCREYFDRNHTPGRILDMYEEIIGELITQ